MDVHDPNACVFCLEFKKAMPKGKPGITAREAAGVLEDVDGGLMTATASRLLVQHGWRELPNRMVEDSPRFAPPEGMR